MRQCKACKRTHQSPQGCKLRTIKINGIEYLPIPYGKETAWEQYNLTPGETCRDCETPLGKYHHLNCCVEQCPVCGEQWISCNCIAEK